MTQLPGYIPSPFCARLLWRWSPFTEYCEKVFTNELQATQRWGWILLEDVFFGWCRWSRVNNSVHMSKVPLIPNLIHATRLHKDWLGRFRAKRSPWWQGTRGRRRAVGQSRLQWRRHARRPNRETETATPEPQTQSEQPTPEPTEAAGSESAFMALMTTYVQTLAPDRGGGYIILYYLFVACNNVALNDNNVTMITILQLEQQVTL